MRRNRSSKRSRAAMGCGAWSLRGGNTVAAAIGPVHFDAWLLMRGQARPARKCIWFARLCSWATTPRAIRIQYFRRCKSKLWDQRRRDAPPHAAAMWENLNALNALIAAGADLNAQNYGRGTRAGTPLHAPRIRICPLSRRFACARRLIEIRSQRAALERRRRSALPEQI